jgi:hypothetical protein
MTSRQRLLATLRHQTPDRYSWAPLLDDYFMKSLAPEQPAAGIPAFLRDCEARRLSAKTYNLPQYRQEDPVEQREEQAG